MSVKANKTARRMKSWLYVLIDPRDGEIRYAGQADDPKARWRGYCRCTGASNADLARWLMELKDAGLQPKMQIVARIIAFSGQAGPLDTAILNGAERAMVKSLERGGNLLNVIHTKKANLARK